MRIMKKILFSLIAVIGSFSAAYSQLAWIEPDPTIATQTIRIYVDLSKLDMSKAHHVAIAAHAGPMYFWTWKPFEFPVGSPKVNGEGEQPWKNSNELLKMTPAPDKGEKVWYFEMVPTEFYEVTASDVYTKGISFLVKPKDGGGFGDPDIKTDDINLVVSPPKTDKGSLYNYPLTLSLDEVTTFVYDNAAEKNPTMKNMGPDEVLYIHIKATAEDTATGIITTYQPSLFLQVQNNPALLMTRTGTTQFKLMVIPRKLLNIPEGLVPIDVEIVVRRKAWGSVDDTGGEKPKIKFGCD
jgi:hypothetical protein